MTTEATGIEKANAANGCETTDRGTTPQSTKRRVLICDTQPVAVEGLKWLIENSGDLRVEAAVSTLEAVTELLNPGAAARLAAELAALSASSAEVETPDAAAINAAVPEDANSTADILACANATALTEGVAGLTSETTKPEPVAESIIGDAAFHDTAFCDAMNETEAAMETEAEPLPDPLEVEAIVLDKGFGMISVMEFLQKLAMSPNPVPTVVWGAISEAEALRLLQAGARGIVRRTSESGTLLTCLRAVTGGGTWMEDGIFGSTDKLFNPRRSQLTHREAEVVELVEKGLRNRDIARILGIQTGTVKIHLKHIFEKTGVRGRYGLAYTGLQNKGSILPTSATHFGV